MFKSQVHVRAYGAKADSYRIAWSALPERPAQTLDFRTAQARALVAAGDAGVEHVSGTAERDCAYARAAKALNNRLTALSLLRSRDV